MNTYWREQATARGIDAGRGLAAEHVSRYGYSGNAEDVTREYWETASGPLSGEWSGESIAELFGLAVGEEVPEEVLEEYEETFTVALAETVAEEYAAIRPY